MQYDDDIAFQRAILANPGDTTLKLVYADWLQERDDPRAEYVRLQVQLHTTRTSAAAVDAAAWFMQMGNRLDPDWVAFMRKSFGKS
ncbi:MAG: TIGR02996 domain-containing protein [Planctomycetia bacterium]|nr:TIGR02996 domain-containing protein [Planctomycetia bacterium]